MNLNVIMHRIREQTLLSICFIVPRCQCSPPANASDQLEQEWNRTGYSPDSVPWSSLNVSVREAHSDLQCRRQYLHPHSQSHVKDVQSKQTSSASILLCKDSLILILTDLVRHMNTNARTATTFSILFAMTKLPKTATNTTVNTGTATLQLYNTHVILLLFLQMCKMLHGEFVGPACGHHGPYIPDVLFWSIILFFTTFFLSSFLKQFKTERYFPTKVRCFLDLLFALLFYYTTNGGS